MDLIKFKPTGKLSTDVNPDAKVLQYQWVLNLEKWSINLDYRISFSNSNDYCIGRYIGVGISKFSHFGYYTTWNDGKHNSIWLGPFYLSWSF